MPKFIYVFSSGKRPAIPMMAMLSSEGSFRFDMNGVFFLIALHHDLIRIQQASELLDGGTSQPSEYFSRFLRKPLIDLDQMQGSAADFKNLS